MQVFLSRTTVLLRWGTNTDTMINIMIDESLYINKVVVQVVDIDERLKI